MHTFRLALLTLFIAAVAFAAAPKEERALAWIRAYNEGAEALEAFAAAHYAPATLARRTKEERRAFHDRFSATHGRFEVVRVTDQGIVVKAAKGATLTLEFDVEPQPPHRIANVGIEMGDGQPATQLPPLSGLDALDDYMKKLVDADRFSGTVLVARNGQPLFERAYGMASRRYSVPNRNTTRFSVGSITKDFTKVAIAQLAQAGKLKLTDTIATHLPDYPNQEVARKVTIEQMLEHRSGLGDIFTPRFFGVGKANFHRPSDFIQFFASDPLHFEPGQGQRYSNYGYTVLGAIIEAITKESYFDSIQKNVFDRASMSGSGFFDLELPTPDVAMGHTKVLANGEQGKEWREIMARRYSVRGIPAGGSYSNARDLLAFDRAMRAGKLADETWTRWFYGGDPKGSAVLAGGSPGVNAVLASDGTWTVVVLANVDPGLPEDLGEHIFKSLAAGGSPAR
ncbi:MAG TPA: serine hydrolase domain-containing protein [Thermoanaerobaculia bacterium]